jgi:hypothetical protein
MMKILTVVGMTVLTGQAAIADHMAGAPTEPAFDSGPGYTGMADGMDKGAFTPINDVTDVTDTFGNSGGSCLSFSNENALGQWGQTVSTEVASGRFPLLLQGPQDIQQLCPKYNRLLPSQKKELWVVILNSMAGYESSCRPTVPARGVAGRRAMGLFQLHAGHEGQYSSGCRNGDGSNAARSITCTLSMLNDQVGRDGRFFSDSSYWAVLRPHNFVQKAPKIERAVSMFRGCN